MLRDILGLFVFLCDFCRCAFWLGGLICGSIRVFGMFSAGPFGVICVFGLTVAGVPFDVICGSLCVSGVFFATVPLGVICVFFVLLLCLLM